MRLRSTTSFTACVESSSLWLFRWRLRSPKGIKLQALWETQVIACNGNSRPILVCLRPVIAVALVAGLGAEAARKLRQSGCEKDASLLAPESKSRFLDEIEAIYGLKHAVTITLSPGEIALADMVHEDDLPSA
jgi:hypothetical protein